MAANGDRADAARQLVRNIAQQRGCLDETTLGTMSSEAKLLSATPFICLRVHPTHIVVDCNEDGFTRENLIAICNVGKSSKQGAQGYIGEKGIGFKSVFMVAWKAHIQSGDFSFSFQHRPGESGMGMIFPVWEEIKGRLNPPLTRITLYLLEATSGEGLPRQHETTVQQFRELEATILLFMKNLRRIEVSIYNSEKQVFSSTFTHQPGREAHRVELQQRVIDGRSTRQTSRHFHVATGKAHSLARSENRTYTDIELANKTYATADVVLAFPLLPDLTPLIEVQDDFAFLPLRKVGFPSPRYYTLVVLQSPSTPCSRRGLC
ncbi:hypothetical protein BO71DRAFT_428866 [Aspergillus ellipticus CBS 707.79]|uniref:Uncharacterized protein n=1 Tax=Aspergillus ellipticus CBS 707.79 TaxID=1448320 RepID=A0A319DW31_9EURO|nr:hypothetical protein BO71DRAFT_428866 [Aspergillus ellipticus CBS 707.79]